jgi:hypothetical protein
LYCADNLLCASLIATSKAVLRTDEEKKGAIVVLYWGYVFAPVTIQSGFSWSQFHVDGTERAELSRKQAN